MIFFYKGLTQKSLELCIGFWGIESNDKAVMIQTLTCNRTDFFLVTLKARRHPLSGRADLRKWKHNKHLLENVLLWEWAELSKPPFSLKQASTPSIHLCGISGSLTYVLWSSHSHIPGCTAMGADPSTFQGSCLCSRKVTKYGLEKARPVRRKGKCDGCMFS